jgi:uncharacterized Zn-binding protein involved in type VI secretion
MPGFIVTMGSTVLCAHAGQATPVPSNARVLIDGQPVILQPDPWMVAGCAFPPPPAGNGPCVTASFVTGSVRTKINGVPVVLQDSQAVCTPTGTPLTIVATQTRVRGT